MTIGFLLGCLFLIGVWVRDRIGRYCGVACGFGVRWNVVGTRGGIFFVRGFLVNVAFTYSILTLLFTCLATHGMVGFPRNASTVGGVSRSVHGNTGTCLGHRCGVITVFFLVVFLVLSMVTIFGLLAPCIPFTFVANNFFSTLSNFVNVGVTALTGTEATGTYHSNLGGNLHVTFSTNDIVNFAIMNLNLLSVSV